MNKYPCPQLSHLTNDFIFKNFSLTEVKDKIVRYLKHTSWWLANANFFFYINVTFKKMYAVQLIYTVVLSSTVQ